VTGHLLELVVLGGAAVTVGIALVGSGRERARYRRLTNAHLTGHAQIGPSTGPTGGSGQAVVVHDPAPTQSPDAALYAATQYVALAYTHEHDRATALDEALTRAEQRYTALQQWLADNEWRLLPTLTGSPR
jgi:hypothetical protein